MHGMQKNNHGKYQWDRETNQLLKLFVFTTHDPSINYAAMHTLPSKSVAITFAVMVNIII